MALALTLPRTLNVQAGLIHALIEAPGLSFFACLQRPRKGSPLIELSKHERGPGWSLIAGPLLVEVSLA